MPTFRARTENDPDRDWLRQTKRPSADKGRRLVRVVDLFSGCGGMTLGVQAAALELGARIEVALAADMNSNAAAVYQANFSPLRFHAGDVSQLFDGKGGDELTDCEKRLKRQVGRVDVLVGGPPCQGHSDLNNHTRRNDPRNELYMVMARAAKVFMPKVVVIENVAAVRWDRRRVVERTLKLLGDDYTVVNETVKLDELGVPQRRRRHILLAIRKRLRLPEARQILVAALDAATTTKRDLRWAIGDLEGREGTTLFDTASTMSEDNKKRAAYLFRHDAYDLPDSQRPKCHRDGGHSYTSVYGRLKWDAPAQTITTGFGSMGQGRYVHPSEQRTITPHEAARLQSFPDYFDFSAASGRGAWALLIGNAVPALSMKRIVAPILPSLVAALAPKKTSIRRAAVSGRG